jgi:crotonobetainyl-CoA:carnitine CoA-transferase CaiB-like acyl-CoA transferase
VPRQAGNNHPTSIPTGVFKTKDGYINIASAGQAIWERFCKAIQAEEFLSDRRYADGASRSEHRDALNAAIEAYTVHYTSADLIALLNQAGVPCGPIYSIDQVFHDPQVQHLGMAQDVHHPVLGDIQLVGQPFTLSRHAKHPCTAAPERGQDTETVLTELGLDSEELKSLRQRHII